MLSHAISNGHTEIAELLFAAGATDEWGSEGDGSSEFDDEEEEEEKEEEEEEEVDEDDDEEIEEVDDDDPFW